MAKKKTFQISDALTEGLEATISAANHYSGQLSVDVISIKKIELDPDNPRDLALTFEDLYRGVAESDEQQARKLREMTSLKTIAHSIQEQGIINPIVVYKHGEKYRLVAGERRTLASIMAGKLDIQAKILDGKPNELKVSLLQWIENVERSDLTLWERLRNLEKIAHAYANKKGISPKQVTITELSQLIGCTKPHAINYKLVLHAEAPLKKLIQENKIKNLEKAALIASLQSQISQQRLMDACLSGASLKKLKMIAEHEASQIRASHSVVTRKRGRQAGAVHLGTTKNIKVAKIILDTLLKSQALSPFSSQWHALHLNDYQSVTSVFKSLLKKLEELHAT